MVIKSAAYCTLFCEKVHPAFNNKAGENAWWWTPEKKKITTDDKCFRRALSCLFWLLLLNSCCFWKILTVFVLFLLLCLITDYHCHLLSSICYCANDEMNLFKQYLKRWQKPQLLQWLSPLISNHFSNLNQRCFLLPCFFPWKSSNERWERAPNFQEEQEGGKKREGTAQLLETKEKGQVSVFWGKNWKVCRCLLILLLPRWQVCQGPESPCSIITRHPISPSKGGVARRGAIRSLWLKKGNPRELHL